MAKIEDLQPRRILPVKCWIDGQEIATKRIRFTYGWTMPLCEEHLKEIKALKESQP